ncbi:MAG TPA: DUF4795 domain-containing protein, partial [Candidatus Paenibacillus intestinavium]|nr:DUF4795 domain-containing protein [Candidatus Paenibacillus intestinavium]
MKTMYPGMVNSPITELAADMTAGTDSITVLNGDALPIPPNLFVIGQGEFAETVLFTVKSGNTISGLTRGLQGVARAWPSGAKLSRNFTEYDYRALIDNVNEAFNTLAPLDSPEFTDIPTAPTAAPMTNTKQIANTEFVTEAVLSLDASITSLDDEVISVKESVQDVSSQLAETEQQIDQLETTKANESDVNEKFNLKRDKNVKINNSDLDISSDANKVKLINLSDEVHAAMAGTAPVNPVIPNVSITREKSAPLSYTRNMTGFYENASSNLYDKTYNTPGYFDYLTGA